MLRQKTFVNEELSVVMPELSMGPVIATLPPLRTVVIVELVIEVATFVLYRHEWCANEYLLLIKNYV